MPFSLYEPLMRHVQNVLPFSFLGFLRDLQSLSLQADDSDSSSQEDLD